MERNQDGRGAHIASYMGHDPGLARDVLFRELVALDGACRERYGLAVAPEDSRELGAEAGESAAAATPLLHRRTDLSADRPADWPSIPGLELVEVLGSGGMGVVFKARQARLDRDVAVKFLRNAHRADSEQRERFAQEARAVARLRHPHLVAVYEFGEAPPRAGPRRSRIWCWNTCRGAAWRTSCAARLSPPERPHGSSKRWPTPSITPTSRGSSIAT